VIAQALDRLFNTNRAAALLTAPGVTDLEEHCLRRRHEGEDVPLLELARSLPDVAAAQSDGGSDCRGGV